MAKKVTVAIFDNDLRCEIKKCEVADGNKIRIKSGGDAHHMPYFDPETFLEFPTRKKFLFFGERVYKRYYIVRKLASKCVNFGMEPPDVPLPDVQQVMDAAKAELVKNFGKEKQELHPILLIIAAISLLTLLMTMGVI